KGRGRRMPRLLAVAGGALLFCNSAHAQSDSAVSSTTAPAVSVSPPGSAPAAYRGGHALPIDLPTTLRLVDANNPTIALAQARVREAYARLSQADALGTQTSPAGPTYPRHDGQWQNSLGNIITTSKSNIFFGGGLQMRFDTADVYFLPLIAQRLTEAEAARARSTSNDI